MQIGSKAVTNAINKSLKQLGELANMDNIRAMALTETAFAGQVADFAQSVRLQEGRARLLQGYGTDAR